MRGIILYGPPAAGKDTVTRELEAIDSRYRLFPRLKVGGGRTAGYRMVTAAQLAELRDRGDVLWENDRYGATYAIDRAELRRRLGEHIPVVHLGQVDAIEAVTRFLPAAVWLVVYLWCPREVAERRIAGRRTGDSDSRLQAWDETFPLIDTPLTINSAETFPDAAARAIDACLRRQSPS